MPRGSEAIDPVSADQRGVGRRTVATGIAWGVPAVALASASPAFASSGGSAEPTTELINWAGATFRTGGPYGTDHIAEAWTTDGLHLFRVTVAASEADMSGGHPNISDLTPTLLTDGADLLVTLTHLNPLTQTTFAVDAINRTVGGDAPSAGFTLSGLVGSADSDTSDLVTTNMAGDFPLAVTSSTALNNYTFTLMGQLIPSLRATGPAASLNGSLTTPMLASSALPTERHEPGGITSFVAAMVRVPRATQTYRISSAWIRPA